MTRETFRRACYLVIFLALLGVLTVNAHAQNECSNVPPNIAIAVNNSRGNDQIVHQTICWNPATNTISIPSLAGGAVSFATITGGTNVAAAMIVGTGASLTAVGAGTIVATSCPTCSGGFPVNGPTAKLTQTVASQVSADLIGSADGTGDALHFAASFQGSVLGSFGVPVFRMLSGSGWKESSAQHLDWTWTDKANDYIGLKSDATLRPGLVLSSLSCLDYSSTNNLGTSATMSVDTTLCRTSPQNLRYGNGSNAGSVTTLGANIALPTGSSMGASSIYWEDDGPGQGFFDAGGVNKVKEWGDNGGFGAPLWGWTGTFNSAGGLFAISGTNTYLGFGDSVTGACTHCLLETATGLSSNTAAVALATYTASQYLTPNCATIGSSANPSVVSCGGFSAGSFSCAVAASTGTCVVNTTAVTAISTIIVTPSSAEGAEVGVTCNTAPTLVPTITLKTKGAGTFTLNMPTIATNPECFTFLVVN